MTNPPSKRGRFGYPVLDSDGHTIEFVPALFDILEKVAGPKIVERYRASFEQGMYGWYDLTRAERAHRRYVRPPWWAGFGGKT